MIILYLTQLNKYAKFQLQNDGLAGAMITTCTPRMGMPRCIWAPLPQAVQIMRARSATLAVRSDDAKGGPVRSGDSVI